MKKHLTQGEALEDFLQWAKQQPTWKKMTRHEKQYIYKAREAERKGKLGPQRLDTIFGKWAPGRYVGETYYTINEGE